MLRELTDNVWIWSQFSDEKQLDFNGTLLCSHSGGVLIDPVELTQEQITWIKNRTKVQAVLLTNKDHRRAALNCRDVFRVPVWIHELDKDLVDCEIDHTFRHYDRLPLGLNALHLEHLKSPGETAFYLGSSETLVLGDALIGKPAGELSLLPKEKVVDPMAARESLRRLSEWSFETLVVGDGEPFASGGKVALNRFLDNA